MIFFVFTDEWKSPSPNSQLRAKVSCIHFFEKATADLYHDAQERGGGFACSVGDSQTNVPVLINIDHVVTVWRWKTTAIPVQTCRICCPGDECTAEYIWAIGGYKYISLCYQCSKPDALLRGSLGHNAKRRQIFPPVPCGVQKEFGPPNLIV
jgi:hypothetical protein